MCECVRVCACVRVHVRVHVWVHACVHVCVAYVCIASAWDDKFGVHDWGSKYCCCIDKGG
jgi:hypothetical protein